MGDINIEKLSEEHDTSDFFCGESALDVFLKNIALDHQKKVYGKTWVACEPRSLVVQGFYTLTVAQIEFENAPKKLIRGMPKYPVPCFLLARLAVHKKYQNKGLGSELVAHSFERCATAGAGAKCLLVDAKNEKASQFYRALGFRVFPNKTLQLFIKMSTIEQALCKAK